MIVTLCFRILTRKIHSLNNEGLITDEELHKLCDELLEISSGHDKDTFICKFLYNKTGVFYNKTKTRDTFKNYIKTFKTNSLSDTPVAIIVDEMFKYHKFINNIIKCNVTTTRYTDYEVKTLNRFLKAFVQYECFDDIANILGDILQKDNVPHIPFEELIDIIKIALSVFIQNTIMAFGNHKASFFSDSGIIKKMFASKKETETYSEAFVRVIIENKSKCMNIYSYDELYNKIIEPGSKLGVSNLFNTYMTIINNNGWDNIKDISIINDGVNTIERDHIKPTASFTDKNEKRKYSNMIGNLSPLNEYSNKKEGAAPFEIKRKTYMESNFQMNRLISQSEIWGIEEIIKESERRAKIIVNTIDISKYIKVKDHETNK